MRGLECIACFLGLGIWVSDETITELENIGGERAGLELIETRRPVALSFCYLRPFYSSSLIQPINIFPSFLQALFYLDLGYVSEQNLSLHGAYILVKVSGEKSRQWHQEFSVEGGAGDLKQCGQHGPMEKMGFEQSLKHRQKR